MKLKVCVLLLALSMLSLHAEEDLSVGQLRKRLANLRTSEESVDEPISSVDGLQAGSCLRRGRTAPPEPYIPPPPPPEPVKKQCAIESPQRFQVGGTYSYSWITPSGNATTRGNLGGVQAIYEYRPLSFVYAGAAFNWRAGKTKYHSTSTRTLEDFNLQERIGYTFGSPWRSRFTVFTGIGARYMAEKVTISSTSIKFDYTEFYAPLGFLLEKEFGSAFSIGCNFQWMPQIFPMVKIKPLNGARWDLTYQLPNFAVDVPFKIAMGKQRQFAVIIDPFFEYWRNGHTTAKTSRGLALNLPGNKYLFAGVNVNLAFSF